MLILLTNDDGIRAPGIAGLYRALTQLGEVHVVAPETVQSATGHGITLDAPLLTQTVTLENAFTGVAVDGRPADCVKVAVDSILPRRPDLVVSGINAGANTGINVLYSGTVAAAVEAAFLGLPAIAVSLYLRREIETDYDRAASFALPTIRRLVEGRGVGSGVGGGVGPGQVVSINLPATPAGESPRGVRLTRQCLNVTRDAYDRRLDPRGNPYFWNSTAFALGPTDDDTDVAAIRDGYVSVTPLMFDLTDRGMLASLRAAWGEMQPRRIEGGEGGDDGAPGHARGDGASTLGRV